MIRVALVDDHPLLIAGLTAVLRSEPGMVPVGSASDLSEAEHMLRATRPDLLLLDDHLPRGDALRFCHRVKSAGRVPKVLMYSGCADRDLGLAARAAGADGLGSKSAPVRELFELIRRVAGGERVLPPLTPEVLIGATSRLEPEDAPLLSLLLDRTTPQEIAETLRIEPAALGGRVERLLGRLRVEAPSTGLRGCGRHGSAMQSPTHRQRSVQAGW